MEKKKFKFKLEKTDEGKGIFEGYASVFGNVDQGGDVVLKGAFSRTIQAKEGRFKVLWNHDYMNPPIGIATVREDEHGLYTTNSLFINDVPRAAEVFAGIKNGAIDSMSFMYDIMQSEYATQNGDRVRHIKEVKLYEVSPVNFPMNEAAVITGVKSDDLQGLLKQMKEMQEKIKSFEAFHEFKSKIESDLATLHSQFQELAKVGTSSKGGPVDENKLTVEAKAELKALVEKMQSDLNGMKENS